MVFERTKSWAHRLKRDVVALWIAARDDRTPFAAKLLAAAVAAYALSPIDLIPDFIPVLGYLDDLLILPLGILIAVRMIAPQLMAEFRARAAARTSKPISMAAGVVIILIWIASLALIGALLSRG